MYLAIIHPIPVPYREKLFAELARLDQIHKLKVYYCARNMAGWPDWQFNSGQYQKEVLTGYDLGGGFWLNPAVINKLQQERPDVLLVWGWGSLTSQMALLTGRSLNILTVMFSDSAWPVREPTNRLVVGVIEGIKRLLSRVPDAFISQGTLAQQYLQSFGVKTDKIRVLPINCVDTRLLGNQAQIARCQANELKEQLGIRNKPVLLYVGKLIPGKGVSVLLDAFQRLRQETDAALLIVGDGVERATLEAYASHTGLPDVRFLGVQPYETLPQFYGISDCLILPTFSDQWPLVVLEAMACSLPVVTTTRCGSVPDLIEGRGTGLAVGPGDAPVLAQAIEHVLTLSPKEIELMRQCAFQIAAEYDCKMAARRLVEVLTSELNH